MKKLQSIIAVAALVMAIQAHATPYTITFTGGGSSASGEIDVVGGLAVSGYLDVLTGANTGVYDLVGGAAGVFKLSDGTYLSYDNVVNVGSDPFIDDTGLAFADGPAQTAGTIGFNLWSNGPGSYTVFGDPPWGSPYTSGTATLTVATDNPNGSPVPDGGMTVSLLGGALIGLQTLRRKLAV